MALVDLGDIRLNIREDGNPDGAPLVFANSLGTDLRLWDKLVARLPEGVRIIRYDMRGHGGSDCPPSPYAMGQLVRDSEQMLDHLKIRDCVFVGLSIGGMVAQGLAVKRLDLVRAVVLSNTAAKIGQPAMWAERIAAAQAGGIETLADATMERWFTRAFQKSDELLFWRNMMTKQRLEGFIGCMEAISGTDFYTPTSGLRLPASGIAGSDDGSTPPDLVRETIRLIPGSEFHLIRRAGHLPCVDQPDEYARVLTAFLTKIGHLSNEAD